MSKVNLYRKLLDSKAGVRLRGTSIQNAGAGWQHRGAGFGAGFSPVQVAESAQPAGQLESYFDEHTEGLGIWKWRHYFPVYERHLERFRDRPVRVLEIGVFSGGSLEMWRSYFGTNAAILGVDIDEACLAYARPGIEIAIGDQSDPTFWTGVLADRPPFDVVIDDGGHETHQQVATIEAVLPRMAPGGVYICEDVHHQENGFAAYMAGLARNMHAMPDIEPGGRLRVAASPFQQAVGSIHTYPYLIVVERRDHRLDELSASMHGTDWNLPEGWPGADNAPNPE